MLIFRNAEETQDQKNVRNPCFRQSSYFICTKAVACQ